LHEDPCGIESDADTRSYSSCLNQRNDLLMFRVHYTLFESIGDDDKESNYPFVLRTEFKDDTKFPGCVLQHDCGLRLAIMEYAVELTNNSIALKHRHEWHHDKHVADVAYFNGESYAWINAYTLLNPSVKVLCKYWYPRSDEGPQYQVTRLVNCGGHGYESSTVNCLNNLPVTLLDLWVVYLQDQETHSISCNSTWQDPMPVSSC
jgi:hypothetical protein